MPGVSQRRKSWMSRTSSTNSDEGLNEYRDNFPAVPPSDYNRLFAGLAATAAADIQGDDIVVASQQLFSPWETIAT